MFFEKTGEIVFDAIAPAFFGGIESPIRTGDGGIHGFISRSSGYSNADGNRQDSSPSAAATA